VQRETSTSSWTQVRAARPRVWRAPSCNPPSPCVGGHCGGGAIKWPNATWGIDVAQAFSFLLFAQQLTPGGASDDALREDGSKVGGGGGGGGGCSCEARTCACRRVQALGWPA
jgi:hypothetical protein